MKILYFTDTHIRGTSPQNRLDDFPKSLEIKLEEIVNIIKDEDIDYVLHGGDLFDRPDVSISVVSSFIRILREIPVPIYLISGNHDVFGHNPKTVDRTIIGLLEELDFINLLNGEEKKILEKDNIKIQLTGQPYIYDIDDKSNRDYYMVNDIEEDVDYSIHMSHGMLLDKPFIKGVPHTLIDDIKNTKADITLGGHYHTGFKTAIIDNKYFINPGSIARVSNSLMEIKRRPKIIILEFKKEEEINIREIYLKNIKPGDKVLDRKSVEDNIYKRERMFEFKQKIDAAVEFDKMDINEVLIEVSTAEGVEDQVKKEALKRVAEIQMKDLAGD